MASETLHENADTIGPDAVDLHRRWLAGEGDITQRRGSRQYNRLVVTALTGSTEEEQFH